jgi:hypothetical protein
MKAFSNVIKSWTFFTFMTWLLLKQTSEMLRTRYREPVQYIGSLDWKWRVPDCDKTSENDSGNCSIWNKFYIKDVYLNKNSKYVLWFTLLDILSIHLGIKNGKQLMFKWNRRIIANWVLKLKIKMSWCCIILNNMLKNLPVVMEASTGNLNPLD